MTHREVSIKLLRMVESLKSEIRSNGEIVRMVEWWVTKENYIAIVTYTYFDGHSNQEDAIELIANCKY